MAGRGRPPDGPMTKYDDLVRRSIRKDFAGANFKRKGRAPRTPHPKNTKRVLSLTDESGYAKYRRLIVGRLVRIVEDTPAGKWIEFVREPDRDALNAAAGWKGKKRFLLDGAKFDD